MIFRNSDQQKHKRMDYGEYILGLLSLILRWKENYSHLEMQNKEQESKIN
jgi:hypothetical protein